MQDMVGGDNNRTPVIFRDPDNCNFVGDIELFESSPSLWKHEGQLRLQVPVRRILRLFYVIVS